MVRKLLFAFGIVVSAITVLIMIDIGCRIFDLYAGAATQAGINRAISVIGIVIGLYIIRLLVEDIEELIDDYDDYEEDIEAPPLRNKPRLIRPNFNERRFI